MAWLNAKRLRRIGERVRAQMEGDDLYTRLSIEAHGDPRSVLALFDEEASAIRLEPRRTHATKVSLLLHAGFARDQAVVIAEPMEFTLRGMDVLDKQIEDGLSRVMPE